MGKKMKKQQNLPDQKSKEADNFGQQNIEEEQREELNININQNDNDYDNKFFSLMQKTTKENIFDIPSCLSQSQEHGIWSQQELNPQVRYEDQSEKKLFQKQIFSKSKAHFRKNNNVPKLINRQFLNIYHHYLKHLNFVDGDIIVLSEIKKFLEAQRKKYTNVTEDGSKKKVKNINYNLQSLKKLYGWPQNSIDPKRRGQITRKLLFQFLRTNMKKLALNEKQIEMHREYLLSLKVFSLRCRNNTLIGRTQCH